MGCVKQRVAKIFQKVLPSPHKTEGKSCKPIWRILSMTEIKKKKHNFH